jgi:hypothetical protein
MHRDGCVVPGTKYCRRLFRQLEIWSDVMSLAYGACAAQSGPLPTPTNEDMTLATLDGVIVRGDDTPEKVGVGSSLPPLRERPPAA